MTRILLFVAAALFSQSGWTQSLEGARFETVRLAGAPAARVSATLAFGPRNVSGNGGCNQYNGSYRLPGARRVRFGSLISTRMYCGPASAFESRYFAALSRARSYRLRGGELRLFTGGRRPRLLMVLRKAD